MQACLAGQALLFHTRVLLASATPPREAETPGFRLLLFLFAFFFIIYGYAREGLPGVK